MKIRHRNTIFIETCSVSGIARKSKDTKGKNTWCTYGFVADRCKEVSIICAGCALFRMMDPQEHIFMAGSYMLAISILTYNFDSHRSFSCMVLKVIDCLSSHWSKEQEWEQFAYRRHCGSG